MVRLLSRKSELYRIVGATLICYLTGLLFAAPGLCAAASPTPAAAATAHERVDLVQVGVAYYEQKALDKAKARLEEARTAFPENYAVPYYLGLIHLEQGDRMAAIAQWQDYLKLNPESENAQMIRKNITLLLREQAQEDAKQAVSQEAILARGQGEDNTIAITAFNNLGSINIGPLGKGIASMIIADLSQVPTLNVVDRIKLQALLEELKLGTSGLVSIDTAPRVGKLLKAKHVASGTLADIEADNLMVASAVINADSNISIGAQEAKGEMKKFYDMEKEIVLQIIEDLGIDPESTPPAVKKIHTKSMPALILYSEGLDQFDKGDYDRAREMFQESLEEDPEFELAMAALLATPSTAMASMDKTQMISRTSSSGPPSATAGSAVAGSTVDTTETAAAASTSSAFGISPMTATIGGVVIIGGGLALAGGGGGGGGGGPEPGPEPAKTLSLTGDWIGSWDAQDGATFILTQDGSDNVSGNVRLQGDPCMTTGNISGSVSGANVNLTIESDSADNPQTVVLTGTIDSAAKTLSGSMNYQSQGPADCTDKSGGFSVRLNTGSADVEW